jgi:polar amino acid transport system substrate-binding protein
MRLMRIIVFPAFSVRRLVALLLTLVLAVSVSALLPMRASAQQEPEFYDDQPYAPGQWNLGRRFDQSEFRYCVDPRDPSWQVDGEIADAIAGDLLLQPKRYVVQSQEVVEDLTKLYAILLQNCDVYMGFKLIPDGYPSWVTLTRAYDQIGYVFVTPKPELHALTDLPPGRPIAATLGTTAHFRLVSYNMAVTPDKRWPTYPYGTNELALGAVQDGTADVGLVWGPSFWDVQQHDPAYAAFHIIDSKPLPPTTLGVGALLLKQNTFLRSSIDQAINALIADGTIKGIIDKYKYPATVTATP